MNRAILTTKLRPPPAPPDHALRPRLLDRLQGAAGGRLTLISAPAGYGKTTLLASWADWSTLPVAWLSLDEADNAPDRFLRHLVAALQRRDETLRELGDFVGEDLEAALITVVNDLADNDEPLVLALDDVHLLRGQRVHELLRFLLDHGPEQLRLVLASRSDPPLPLARLRVAGELAELRTDELRLTVAEAAAMLAREGLDLAPADIEELSLRTEGWPAGLHLAALSLQGRADPHAFIGVFTGTDRFVLDYLTEEVLVRQPPAVQDFLLMTSVLDDFDADLARAVTGDRDAGAMLERIERQNLFLTPVDAERRRFRYHAFFGDLLRHRLGTARPDLPEELHRRAADALEARGELDDAVMHRALASDRSGLRAAMRRHPNGPRLERALAQALGGKDLDGLLRLPPTDARAELRAALREALELSAEEGRAHGAAGMAAGPASDGPPRAGDRAGDRAAGRTPHEPLSERERGVLRLIAAGLSNKQIARHLDLSPNTVKTHARNIYGKLDVGSRTQAAARARELELV